MSSAICNSVFPFVLALRRIYARFPLYSILLLIVMSSKHRSSTSRATKYDHIIKLLLIGDSGRNFNRTFMLKVTRGPGRYESSAPFNNSLLCGCRRWKIMPTFEILWWLFHVVIYNYNWHWLQNQVDNSWWVKSKTSDLGHCWTGKISNYNNCLLPGCDGNFARIRCIRWE